MDIQKQISLLDAIILIYEKAAGTKLKPVYFKSINTALIQAKEYFNLNEEESFILSLFIAAEIQDSKSADLLCLAKHIDCSKLRLMKYNVSLDNLIEIGYLEKNINCTIVRLLGSNMTGYTVNPQIVTAVLSNEPLPFIDKPMPMDNFKLLEFVDALMTEREENEISTKRIFRSLTELLKNSEHLSLVKCVRGFHLETPEIFIFLYTLWNAMRGITSFDLHRMLFRIYNDPSLRMEILLEFISRTHLLVSNQLIEVLPGEMTNDAEIQLTEYAYTVLEEIGIKLKIKGYKRKDVIKPEDIMEKSLIFHESELNQLSTLQKLLQPESFTQMQDRLKAKGLPTGVTVLLHGAPGTGKTEIAKQIAKQTGRELMHVNISQCKTMWFGESEKLIKKIFTEYNSYSKFSDLKPILFFNEADALIGKRRELKGYGTEQTENAIQNILLEEIEVFDGILIATTNLANNMDAAFERRFLYKIAFKTPGIKNRATIWQLKLPDITDNQANQLAESFHFSGGQIDNIIRKKEINELLFGDAISFDQIVEYCQEESLQKRPQTIGFKTLMPT